MKKRHLFTSILFMVIGFVAVSTTLLINGSITFGYKQEDFGVIFTKAIVDGDNQTSYAITDNGKTLTFITKGLRREGEKSKLEFEVTNSSKNYDANVNIICKSNDEENSEYYTIKRDLPEAIAAQGVEKGYVEVELLQSILTKITEELTCTVSASPVGKSENADENMNNQSEEIEFDYSIDEKVQE